MTTRVLRAVLVTAVALMAIGTASAAAAGPVLPAPKAIVLTATPTSTVWSQATRLAVSITPKGGGQPKGGTVTFRAGDTVLGTAVATKRITTLSTTALPAGVNQVTATYAGDTVMREATSNAAEVVVGLAGSTTAVTGATADLPAGERAEIKAIVRPQAPPQPSAGPAAPWCSPRSRAGRPR